MRQTWSVSRETTIAMIRSTRNPHPDSQDENSSDGGDGDGDGGDGGIPNYQRRPGFMRPLYRGGAGDEDDNLNSDAKPSFGAGTEKLSQVSLLLSPIPPK